MKDIITLSGDIGSGKSSVARILSASLGYPIVSAGGMQREIAASMGLTTLELNAQSTKDRSVDDRIDAYTKQLGETRDQIVVDSRLAWHFIPVAFKVFLTVDTAVGAQRVFDASRAEEKNDSLQETLANNQLRRELESSRWRTLYGIEMRDYRNYDLLVDTSYAAPDVVAHTIEMAFSARRAGRPMAQCWMSPKRLIDAPVSAQTPEAMSAVVASIRTVDNNFVIASGRAQVETALRNGVALMPATLVE